MRIVPARPMTKAPHQFVSRESVPVSCDVSDIRDLLPRMSAERPRVSHVTFRTSTNRYARRREPAEMEAGHDARRGPQAREGRGDRVLPCTVRGDERQAQRQADARPGDRRSAGGGGGLRRLCRRPHRADPGLARHAGRAGHGVVHARAVAARARALRLRRDGRGRALAVLPAHHPAQCRGACREARLPPQDGPRGRVLPGAQGRGRPAGRGRSARYERAALLRRQGAVSQLRVPDHALALRERARLRQLRERPRGRERSVRVQLHL